MGDHARAAGSGWLHGIGLCCAVAVLSCSAREPSGGGGLLIVVDSDLSIPKDLDHLSLEVTAQQQSLLHVDEPIGRGHLLIPAQWSISSAQRAPVTVRALALRDGVPKIERSAVTQIPRNYVSVLRLPLHYLCDETAREDGSSTCGAGRTCILGSCRAADVPAGRLPSIESVLGSAQRGDSVTAADGGAEGCFDVRACMLEAQEVKLDPESCTFALPEGTDPARLNLALVLPPGDLGICDDDACYVALDRDEDYRVDGAHVQLPLGLCGRLAEHPFEVRLSTTCTAKSTRVPLCGAWSPATMPIESPVGPACNDLSERSCGKCGVQRRTCRDGRWSAFDTCHDEGECVAGEERSCGSAGVQRCKDDCVWEESCVDQRCLPAGPTTQRCGNCQLGSQSRSCDPSTGKWSTWSECSGAGECAPHQTRDCGTKGKQTCSDDCRWGGDCAGQRCEPEAATTRACGNCMSGTQARSCDANSGRWSSWSSCLSERPCAPPQTRSCGSDGIQACGDDCQWQSQCRGQTCLPVGPSTQGCGNCNLGSHTRTCNTDTAEWSSWSACVGGGVCSPHATQSCGEAGVQECTDACTWGACGCVGPSSLACGRCGGTQTRTCNAGEWSAWSVCSRPTPSGRPPGGYEFDTRTGEGWTYLVAQDTDASVPYVFDVSWDDLNQEGSPLNSDRDPQRGAGRVSLGEGEIAVPTGASVDVLSPQLADTSPFQNLSGIRFAAFFPATSELAHPVSARVVLATLSCDNRPSSIESGVCTIQRGVWSVCSFQIDLTGKQKITQLRLRFQGQDDAYELYLLVDSIRAQ